mgnify:CR=1 FL=1|tara:strand:+ start:258 stop:464 length:207 start_codon:yes stop_codon:yes gene_type:complete
MSIWVEYFKYEIKTTNNHAQMKENLKWNPPDSDKIMKRFCQDREQASQFAKSMQEQGYHVTIKQDGMY